MIDNQLGMLGMKEQDDSYDPFQKYLQDVD
jgi:hypothetical protein